MVQINESVGSALKISIHAVAGSGMTSMSDALITFQPWMLEPSKPRPSVKMSSLYSVRVVVKCCQDPGRSVNLKSTSLTSRSLIILLTSDGVFLSLGMDGDGVSVEAFKRLRVEALKRRRHFRFNASALDRF